MCHYLLFRPLFRVFLKQGQNYKNTSFIFWFKWKLWKLSRLTDLYFWYIFFSYFQGQKIDFLYIVVFTLKSWLRNVKMRKICNCGISSKSIPTHCYIHCGCWYDYVVCRNKKSFFFPPTHHNLQFKGFLDLQVRSQAKPTPRRWL